MPTAPLYAYTTFYGVEPYVQVPGKEFSDSGGTTPEVDGPFGAGALITQENLLVSLWTITDIDTRPVGGAALKPLYASQTYVGSGVEDGLKPFFSSRYSTRIAVECIANAIPDDPQQFGYAYQADPAEVNGVLAVLNPPRELKQKLASALRAYLAEGSLRLGFYTAASFEVRAQQAGSFGSVLDTLLTSTVTNYRIGNPLIPALPYAKTSGADGVYPYIWNAATEADEMIQTIADGGDYYIPVILKGQAPDPEDTIFWTISWPHSAARG